MTAVVQPDLGPPPAHKYKDDPTDDPVSACLACFFVAAVVVFSIVSSCLCPLFEDGNERGTQDAPCRSCHDTHTTLSSLNASVLSGLRAIERKGLKQHLGYRCLALKHYQGPHASVAQSPMATGNSTMRSS
jgi:hypothetical protein